MPKAKNITVRLQKYIADCGVTSRRKAEDLIVQGRVSVNGVIVTELGTKVDIQIDVVQVDERVLDLNSVDKIYLVLNKPRGYVTTLSDPEGRKTVMDLCKEITERIFPIGRLDYLSEGLLLLTNDGDVANMIMHPSYNVVKVYEVKVFGAISENMLSSLRKGVQIEHSFIKPLSVRVIKQLKGKTWLEFRLGEGKNREIRKICEDCGLTVDKLKRVAIGNLGITGIALGKFASFSRRQLLRAIGLKDDGTQDETTNTYQSVKKSVDLKRKGPQASTPATDEAFHKFRKETYFDTIKAIKETKKAKEKDERRAQYEESEKKHFARQKKKLDKVKKKGSSK